MTRTTNEFFATDTDGTRYTVSVLTHSYEGIDGEQMLIAVSDAAICGTYSGRHVKLLSNGTYRMAETGAILTADLPRTGAARARAHPLVTAEQVDGVG